jgi:hypothetical protein
MELFSFYINIEKMEILRSIINETDLLNEKIKLYIIRKKCSNIKKDAKNLLKTFFQKNKLTDKNMRDYFFKNDQLKIWGSGEITKDYQKKIWIEKQEREEQERKKKREKYKSSLGIISLTEDEIEIINALFCGYKIRKVKINHTILVGGMECIIDPSTGFRFNCRWVDEDPYAYYITRVVFSKKRTHALLRYGWKGGALDGRGFIAYFTRENNTWKKTDEIVEWMS